MSSAADGAPQELLSRIQASLGHAYEIQEPVGAGGMAVVFRGVRLTDGRPVAIKVIQPSIARVLGHDRYHREVDTLRALDHPSIAPLLDSGQDGDILYLVMPFYSGPSLRERLAVERQLGVDEAVGISRAILDALEYAHRHNTIHRDVKPENILFDGERPILADFGIARAIIRSGGKGFTSTGVVFGTPAYMSPEQAGGERQLDGRADIYSVGCLLFEMIAGVPPFVGPNDQVIQIRHLRDPAPDLRNSRPGVPDGLATAVIRALAKVPADRFRSAADFSRALAPERLGRVRRAWWPAVVGLVALLMAVAGVWIVRARRGAPTVDRYLVLPFHGDGTADPIVPTADQVGRLLWRELSRWRGLDLVDEALVEDYRSRHPESTRSPEAAKPLASALRAGRLIWGSVVPVGDSVEVRAALYRAADPAEAVRRVRVAIPATTSGSVRALTDPMRALVRGLIADETRLADGGHLEGTTSYPALLATLAGDSALAQWDLVSARAAYRAAIAADPQFAAPKLRYATSSLWAAAPPPDWQAAAAGAAAAAGQLAPIEQLEAGALDALARGDFPAACRGFRRVIAADSLRFNGWFGLGECLARDDVVLVDRRSPSGWRFRSSFAAAISSLRTALGLVPFSHRAIGGAAIDRLAEKLMSGANWLRFGRDSAGGNPRFAAYPGFEGDSLAFVPYPIDEVLSGRRMTTTLAQAVRECRRTFLAITSRWIVEYPASPPAIKAHAYALEVNGLVTGTAPESALELIRGLRARLPADSVDLELGAWEVRLLLKAKRYSAAANLATRLLQTPTSPAAGSDLLPGLAAFVGNADRAASLAESYGQSSFVSPQGDVIDSPEGLLRTARRLLVYAAIGGPRDSLRGIEARLRREVIAQIEPGRRSLVLETLRLQAAHLAYPELEPAADTVLPISRIERAIAAGNRDAALAEFVRLDSTRRSQSASDVAPDYLVLEARLLAALGDSAGARAKLDGWFADLRTLNQDVLAWVTQAAAVGRGLETRVALGGDMRSSGADTAFAAVWRRRGR
jgi:hypothetical protein